jgi:hypothetical protein
LRSDQEQKTFCFFSLSLFLSLSLLHQQSVSVVFQQCVVVSKCELERGAAGVVGTDGIAKKPPAPPPPPHIGREVLCASSAPLIILTHYGR